MGLLLIGAGFGRTGTLSLKSALETLGLGRCYHDVPFPRVNSTEEFRGRFKLDRG